MEIYPLPVIDANQLHHSAPSITNSKPSTSEPSHFCQYLFPLQNGITASSLSQGMPISSQQTPRSFTTTGGLSPPTKQVKRKATPFPSNNLVSWVPITSSKSHLSIPAGYSSNPIIATSRNIRSSAPAVHPIASTDKHYRKNSFDFLEKLDILDEKSQHNNTTKDISSIDSPSQGLESSSDETERSTSGSRKRKRARLRKTPEQLAILERQFEINPMPGKQVRDELGSRLGLTTRQVQIWFQNKRAKVKHERKTTDPTPYNSYVNYGNRRSLDDCNPRALKRRGDLSLGYLVHPGLSVNSGLVLMNNTNFQSLGVHPYQGSYGIPMTLQTHPTTTIEIPANQIRDNNQHYENPSLEDESSNSPLNNNAMNSMISDPYQSASDSSPESDSGFKVTGNYFSDFTFVDTDGMGADSEINQMTALGIYESLGSVDQPSW